MSDMGQRFDELREQFWPVIEDMMGQVVAEAGLEGSTLAAMMGYQMGTGGKRLRAILPMMIAEALGEEPAKVVAFGAACELIHNATLVHDDLQDGDRTRRGEETIWVKYGEAQAINLGDALLYLAPLCLDKVEVSGERRWSVARRIFKDILVVVDGQEREFALKSQEPTQEGYEQMVLGKTSGLFALPMAGAAELLGASPAIIAAIEEAARHLGVIFQVQDDILDLYGEKGRVERGGDIREGKISALVVAFQECAPADEVARLMGILKAPREETTSEDVAWAIEMIRSKGALSRAFEVIDERQARLKEIEVLSAHPQLGALMQGLVELFLRPIDGLRATTTTQKG